MRVLTDLHHGVLYEALAMLIEDRWAGELHPWVDGYYVTQPGPQVVDFPPRSIVALTTVEAEAWRPDYMVATVPLTRGPLRDLAHRLGATYVDHVGNAWDGPLGDRALRSVAGDFGQVYHPEFHRIAWTPPPAGYRVASFHSSFETSGCRGLWDTARAAWPNVEFVMYGTADAPLYPFEVAQARADCTAIWHCKDADGYGFAVHEAFAAGRPVIGHASHYRGKLAEPLWDYHIEPTDMAGIEAALGAPEALGRLALDRFEGLVNFDAEAAAVAGYLGVPR